MLVALLACAPPRRCEPTPAPSADVPALDAWVEDQLDAYNLVGLAAAVSGPDGLVWSGAAGFEHLARRVPVEADATKFRWASVSKGITGVLASQLAAEGVVDLHADVRDAYPAYDVPETWLDGCAERECEATIPEADRRVTLHQLLTHTAGTMHYANGQGWGDPPFFLANSPTWNTGMAWALPWWTNKPLVAVPGTRHSYSSYGFNLAGVVLEEAAGERFADLVYERIVAPAGACTVQPDYPWVNIPRRAAGYLNPEEYVGIDVVLEGYDSDVTWKLASGGFVSTVEDLARFCHALVSERLLDRETLDATAWGPHVDVGGSVYGYGFWRNDRHGQTRMAHSGGQPKGLSYVAAYPDLGTCFAVMTNSTWAPIGDLARSLEDTWFAVSPIP
ncbi:MAG: serine hydrolase domain-containing protein [Myxococcota bacterium]